MKFIATLAIVFVTFVASVHARFLRHMGVPSLYKNVTNFIDGCEGADSPCGEDYCHPMGTICCSDGSYCPGGSALECCFDKITDTMRCTPGTCNAGTGVTNAGRGVICGIFGC